MKSVIAFITLSFIIFSCSESPNLEGLWVLKDVSIDMIPRSSKPIYIKFEKGGSFSVSRENGDLIGLYQLDENDLFFSSTSNSWFNTNWTANVYRNELVLEGQEYGYRTTELRFEQVEKFPDFDEFQKELSGTWELYKISKDENEEDINNMLFVITEDDYAISLNDTILEEGKVLIDTRHQKISFENEESIWNARFVWDELRLESREFDVTYRLRKMKDAK